MARKRDGLKQPGDAGSGLSKVQALGVRCSMPDWLLDELAATVVCHTGLEPKDSHPERTGHLATRGGTGHLATHACGSHLALPRLGQLPEHEALGAWAEANQRPPRLALRVNPLRASVEEASSQ